jgi:hypothetical protein
MNFGHFLKFGEIPSADVPLEMLYRQLSTTSDSSTIASLQQQIKDLKQVKTHVLSFRHRQLTFKSA